MDLLSLVITASLSRSLFSARLEGFGICGFHFSVVHGTSTFKGTQPQLIFSSLDSSKKTRTSRFLFTLGFPVIFIFENCMEIVHGYFA